MTGAFGRADWSLQAGKKYEDYSFKVATYFGKGNRSDQNFTDMYGNSSSMAGNSHLNPNMVNTEFTYKDLDVTFLWDHYSTTYQDGYSAALPFPIVMNFDSYLGTAKYDYKLLNDKLVITPQFRFDRYKGWNSEGQDAYNAQYYQDSQGNYIYSGGSPAQTLGITPSPGIYYGRRVDRIRLGVTASEDVTDKLNVLAGVEKNFYNGLDDLYIFSATGTNTVSYSDFAVFGQGMWFNDIVNITAGARYYSHSAGFNSFVPRLALTKILGDVSFKLLASQSFRAPSIDNIDSNLAIQPEKTTVYELEVGYQFSKHAFLTTNIYDSTILNPIVYGVTASNANAYFNSSQTGSRGVDAEFKYVMQDFKGSLSYSYYNTAGKNTVESYAVPGVSDQVLGLPPHKAVLNLNYKINNNLSVNPQAILLGTRYGYDYGGVPSNLFVDSTTAQQSAKLVNYSPTWLLNAFFRYEDLFLKNLDLGAGFFNITNSYYAYIEPYYSQGSGHPPLPAGSREFVADISYKIAM